MSFEPQPAPTQALWINPFPGLRTFEADEDYLFFGREKQIDELLRRLRTNRFLSILGISGSGKSSLVRAGLIPSLYGGGMTRAGSSWRVAILRPGDDPIGNLAAALSAPEALGQDSDDLGMLQAFFETTLRASNLGLLECIRQMRIQARDNVLVLVDQFEEIFRFRDGRKVTGRDDSVAFVKLLLEAAGEHDVPCYVAITMRSDFIGNCMELPGLPETINAGLFLVPRMIRDELRSAITGPVAVGGAAIAPRLVSRLLNDTGEDPDQLPILQHALMRTWACWKEDHDADEPLDLRHYEAIGTMGSALSRHAEEAFAELGPDGQRIAEVLFKALTDKSTDGRGVRRPALLREICELAGANSAQVAAVVETFRKPGRSFLMPPVPVPLESDTLLDLAHESLMRIWERLSVWTEEEARSARLYLGVARAAARHEEGTSGLWRDPELQLALTWREREQPREAWARRYEPSFERAMAFLEASQEERDRETADRERRRRRELRRARALVLILAVASLVTLALGAVAYQQMRMAEKALREATHQKKEAERQAGEAERQRTRAEDQSQLAAREQRKAEEQARLAEEQRLRAEEQRLRAEAQEAEAKARAAEASAARLEAEGRRAEAEEQRRRAEQLRMEAQASESQAQAFAREAELSRQETERLSRLAVARALALQVVRPQPEDQREQAALLALQIYRLNRENRGDPEDPELFSALWTTLRRLKPAPVLRGAEDGLRALVLAPDGQTVYAAGEEGRLLRYDLRRTDQPPAVLGAPGSVRALAVRAGGEQLAAGSSGGQLWVWDLRDPGARPRQLAAAGAVSALAFQPGGPLLASGGPEGVQLWAPGLPDRPTVPLGSGGRRVTSLAFSPDGGTLAAGLAQGGALLWAVGQNATAPRPACGGLDVRSVAFSPDGRLLACGAGRGAILLSGDGPAAGFWLGHASSVNSLSFSPGGDFLASAGSDRTVRLWNLARPGSSPTVLAGHEAWVWSVAFSPDGDRLVSASEDRSVRVWPARTERLAAELCQTVRSGGLTAEEWRRFLPAGMPYPGAAQPCPAR